MCCWPRRARIAGRGLIGVTATQDVDILLRLAPDCVAYMPRLTSIDEVCRILASGASVVTTAFLFHPPSLPAEDRERLRAACAEGGSTIHGNGLNPGVLSGVLPLALSGMSRRGRHRVRPTVALAGPARGPHPGRDRDLVDRRRRAAITAIPAVVAAEPGVATMADLPLIRSGHGFGFA
ncbi:hypothetical protein BH24ACT4_BH24ACT4_05770 [soil metagenome]